MLAYRMASNFTGKLGFLDFVGRSIDIANEFTDDTMVGEDTVSGVTYGSDVGSAMSHELAMPDMMFAAKAAEGSLTQYDRTSSSTKGRGPIILVVDQSGSMDGGGCYNEEPGEPVAHISSAGMAQAMSLACLRVAAAQKRPFACVQFSHVAETTLCLDDASKATARDYLNVLTRWVDGGTSVASGISEAMSLIEAYGYEGADILLFSDGDWECWKSNPDVNHPYIENLTKWLVENEVGLLAFNTYAIGEYQDIVSLCKKANPDVRAVNFDTMNTVESFTEGLREALSQALASDIVED